MLLGLYFVVLIFVAGSIAYRANPAAQSQTAKLLVVNF